MRNAVLSLLVVFLVSSCGAAPKDQSTLAPTEERSNATPADLETTAPYEVPASQNEGLPRGRDTAKENWPAGAMALGRVTDPSGQPVEGICVDLWYEIENSEFPQAAARTDPDGQYVVERPGHDVAHDRFLLRFRDCRGQPSLAFEWFDDVTDMGNARFLSTAGRPVANATLAPAGSISGTITDDMGKPIQGAEVALYDGTFATRDGGEPYLRYAVAASDSSGRYRFTGLAAKGYRVLFLGPRGGPERFAAEWFDDHPDTTDGYVNRGEWPPFDVIQLDRGKDRTGVDARLARGDRSDTDPARPTM